MAAIAALIVVMALMSGRRTSEVELHMDSYNPAAGPNAKKGGIFEGFLEGFNKSLTRNKGGRTSRLTEELAKADIKLRVSEYVMLIVGLIVLLCAVLFLRFHNPVLALAGSPAGYFVPGFFLKFRHRRRLKASNNQLGDTTVLLSYALKPGYSFPQPLATVRSPRYVAALVLEWPAHVLIGMRVASIAIGYGIISKITNIQV